MEIKLKEITGVPPLKKDIVHAGDHGRLQPNPL
jgi:hypothetical protein